MTKGVAGSPFVRFLFGCVSARKDVRLVRQPIS